MRLLLADLKQALDRGVKIRILTGNYLGITQPGSAVPDQGPAGGSGGAAVLQRKRAVLSSQGIHFSSRRSGEIYIGSSNMSRSALTSGIEWNYHFDSLRDSGNFSRFYETFEDLFYRHSILIDDQELARYSREWKKPVVQRDLEQYDQFDRK